MIDPRELLVAILLVALSAFLFMRRGVRGKGLMWRLFLTVAAAILLLIAFKYYRSMA